MTLDASAARASPPDVHWRESVSNGLQPAAQDTAFRTPGRPREDAGTRGIEIYGLAVVSNASVRFTVLPVFA